MGASDTKATGQAGSADMTTTLAKLHAGNEAEIQAGTYMQQQATNGKVKDFAKKMVDDHTALDKDGQRFAQKHKLELTSAPEYQATTSENRSMLEQLKSTQGAERDRHYMQMMVSDHQKDVSEVKQAAEMAKQGGQDKEYAKLLDKCQKKMEGHLKDAQKISRDLGSRQARTRPTSSVSPALHLREARGRSDGGGPLYRSPVRGRSGGIGFWCHGELLRGTMGRVDLRTSPGGYL